MLQAVLGRLSRRPILIGAAAALVLAGALAARAHDEQTGSSHRSSGNGWLGVYIQNIDQDLAESEGLKSTEGVLVNDVMKDSPAEKAGLLKGDVILRFDGKDTQSVRRLTRMITSADPGDKVDVAILRKGTQKTISVTLASDEDMAAAGGDEGNDSEEPDAMAPMPPDAPDAPMAPHAFEFSLGQLSTPRIGVSLYDMSDGLAARLGAKDGGALINEVEKDGPAAKAGLQAGDVIVEVDHKKVYDPDDVRKAIQKKDEGDKVAIMVQRSVNEQKTVDVTIQSWDTWSGMGLPRSFHSRPNNSGFMMWTPQPGARPAMREAMRARRDAQGAMRNDMQAQMDELREQIKELQKQLKDMKR